MMQPPPVPAAADNAVEEGGSNQQTQQSTQPSSQDVNYRMEDHLWGFLVPCNSALPRIDFLRVKPKYKVGRNASVEMGNDVVLGGMKISNFHCEIEWDGQEARDAVVKVYDNSSNGTFINGDKIGKKRVAVLKEGNEIAFGTPQPQPANGGREDYRFVYRHLAGGPPSKGLYAQYDLIKELGKGSFATVMQAMCKENGEFFAVKIIQHNKLNSAALHAGGSGVEQSKGGFAREISILEKLSHPNICQLKEVFFEVSTINLVLEWVPGGDLLDYILLHNGLDEETARRFTYQICDAMAYIHAQDIAHRDLKPENILLTKDNPPSVKVADFGLAKAVDSMTMLRTMCGTPSYLAPEVVMQVGNSGYNSIVDSWSVGVIVFSMITNASPFIEQSNAADIREKIATRQVDWGLLRQHASEECVDFVRRLLEPKPERRMTLTDALEHPWLRRYRIQNGIQPDPVSASIPPPTGNIDIDASMASVAPESSMAMDAEPTSQDSQASQESRPGHIPGSYPQSQPGRAAVRRRRDVVLEAQEKGEDGFFQPSQEMVENAAQEQQRANVQYMAESSRKNKRKSSPLDFEASLTPIQDDEEGEKRAEAAEGGLREDMSMADPEPTPPPPSNGRQKRAKITNEAPPTPSHAKTGGRGGARGTANKARGLRARAAQSEDEGIMSMLDDGPRLRRSSRLTHSPQKPGRR
ncbi:kinase-like domain-containing protein [Abortiporus biennis]|nr:kinase-like domain-containing protein [Abortiporus biennis]